MNNMLNDLRIKMKENGISAYIVMSDDYHQSEYVGEFFRARAALTGFSGSAGYAIVTEDKAILWTDGRYFIQAKKEIENTGFELYKMGVEGFDTIEEFVEKNIKPDTTLAFDGRTMPVARGEKFKLICLENKAKLEVNLDLMSDVWLDRPAMSDRKAYSLEISIAGKSVAQKLKEVRETMDNHKTDWHILSSLDDIAWLLNIRGWDTPNCPFVLSYIVIGKNEVYYFTDKNKLDDTIKENFKNNAIEILDYEMFYKFISEFNFTSDVLIDVDKCNYRIYETLKSNKSISESYVVKKGQNPTYILKAIKNEVELENNRRVHINDSIAVTKFMMWLKTNIGKIDIDEISASDKLLSYRKEIDDFIDESFASISAYGANAAMMHYKAQPESCSKLENRGLYLIDSGGHYMGGTTDITRTIALGELSADEKKHFTMVLKSVIALSKVKFLYGCTGQNLDILCRAVMWNEFIDYKSGTGHGVGYMLNVHEGPNGFRWKIVPERLDSGRFEEGMVTTIEPGVYIEGAYGIRTEQETITRLAHIDNSNGDKYMEFEVITFTPIDLDAIDVSILNKDEIEYLNSYHAEVYEKLSPSFSGEQLELLKQYTRAI